MEDCALNKELLDEIMDVARVMSADGSPADYIPELALTPPEAKHSRRETTARRFHRETVLSWTTTAHTASTSPSASAKDGVHNSSILETARTDISAAGSVKRRAHLPFLTTRCSAYSMVHARHTVPLRK